MDDRPCYQFFFEHQGQVIELPAGETIVGRGLRCGIRFNDAGVSRNHLRLAVEQDRVTAHDAGSSNGTLINGRLLQGETRLKHGDIVQVGQRLLRLALLADNFGETKTPPIAVPAVGRSFARAVSRVVRRSRSLGE